MSELPDGQPILRTNRAAIRYMFISVIGYSLIPISIVGVGGTDSPFLLGGSQAAGHIVGGLAFLAGRYRTRILSTTSDEDQRFIRLVHQFELLISRRVIQAEATTVFRDLYAIDTTPHAYKIEPVYRKLRSLIMRSRSALSSSRDEQAELSALEADLHVFVNSKQQPWNFGEFFALCTFALLTVALALFSHPHMQGWTAFVLEMFTVPFCSVIVFLIFNAWDLQRNRYRPILVEENSRYTLHFHEDADRRAERLVSVLVSIGIWLAFAYVYWKTWL